MGRPGVRGVAGTSLVVAAVVVGAAAAILFAGRYLPPDALAASPDTQAMVVAFTDLAVLPGAAALLLALLALALGRRRGAVGVTGLALVVTLVPALTLAPRWTGVAVPTTGRAFTVLALNSLFGRADPAALTRAAASADVVVLTEATSAQLQGLRTAGFTARFPHRSSGALPPAGAGGTVVFSRFPVGRTAPLSAGLDLQAWSCAIELPGVPAPLTVLAVHPGRPRLGGTHWLPQQDDVRTSLPTSGLRLLAGDFNAVDSHPTMRAIRAEGWHSAVDQAGAGWVPTYPADSRVVPPLVDIDHVYLADGLQATHVESVRVPGTDHLGLRVRVAVTASA